MKNVLCFTVLASFAMGGCPRNQPKAHSVAVTQTLPSASLNCVTVRRNPKTNEAETLDCIDSVTVSAPQHAMATVAEVLAESDVNMSVHGAVTSVSETTMVNDIILAGRLPVFAAENVSEVLAEQDLAVNRSDHGSAIQEGVAEADSTDRKRKVRVSISETVLTVDSLYCPLHAIAQVIETLTTTDQLTCSGI
jgi:hypothetical protein